MKTKKLLKRALKRPELFTEGELTYFRMMEKQRQLKKKESKKEESDFLK